MTHQLPEPAPQLTLPDGTQLDQRQSIAATLAATTNLPPATVAKQAGYASKDTLHAFLRSDRGRDGVAVALKQHLTHAGTVGVKALIKIAEKGRSEMARVSAATKLVEISGIRADEASDPARLGREVNINIDLSGSGHGAQIEGADNELRISAQSDRS